MKKRIILVLVTSMLMVFSGCGDDERTSSTSRSKHESTLTEVTLTEETLVEEIHVEEITVEEIQVNEITWEDNVTYWDDI